MKKVLLCGALGLSGLLASGCDEAGVVRCQEDEAAVVGPNRAGDEDGLNWVCVPLNDFLTEESEERLRAVLQG